MTEKLADDLLCKTSEDTAYLSEESYKNLVFFLYLMNFTRYSKISFLLISLNRKATVITLSHPIPLPSTNISWLADMQKIEKTKCRGLISQTKGCFHGFHQFQFTFYTKISRV